MKFEWDSTKAQANLSKHGVSFGEASTVFGDPLSITIHDPDLSQEEQRFITIGYSLNFRTIVVVHTDRGDTIRIMSARVATRNERNSYEQGI